MDTSPHSSPSPLPLFLSPPIILLYLLSLFLGFHGGIHVALTHKVVSFQFRSSAKSNSTMVTILMRCLITSLIFVTRALLRLGRTMNLLERGWGGDVGREGGGEGETVIL